MSQVWVLKSHGRGRGSGGRQRLESNRATRQEKQRRGRKNKRHEPWRYLTMDQKEVARRLTRGQVTLVAVSGSGLRGQRLEQRGGDQVAGRGVQRLGMRRYS